MLRTLLPLLFLCLTFTVYSQDFTLQAERMTTAYPAELNQQFQQFEVYDIDTRNVQQQFRSRLNDFTLRLALDADKEWVFHLRPSDINSYLHTISVPDGNGGHRQVESPRNVHFTGGLADDPDSEVQLTIVDDLLLAFVRKGDQRFVLEPVRTTVADAPMGQFVLYNIENVMPGQEKKCAYAEVQQHMEDRFNTTNEPEHLTQGRMSCLEVELAIACDYSMFTKYGSVAAAAGFASGIMSAVQSNYSSDFNSQIVFVIVETYVIDCNGCDPWTTSTNASTLLNSFRSWGNGGFPTVGGNFDLAQLWTDRNLAGSTIGIAWLNAVCTSRRYHVCEDFSSNANLLRVLTAHEIGHNFSASHDAGGSGFIMAPSVNNTSTWSNASKNSINNAIPRYACLSDCVSAPEANFAADQLVGCAPLTVQFTDLSTNNPTVWAWSFPGGNPSFSTEANPIVFYDNPGLYTVTLEVSNGAGSDVISRPAYIQVNGPPQISVDLTASGRTVSFTNFTIDATSYFWEFGDGGTSTDESPSYTYRADGNYFIRLTAFNACGQSTATYPVFVLGAPTGSFTADVREGCDDLTVQFESSTTGVINEYLWLFPGGTPDISGEENPQVRYPAPGSYDVTLIVRNDSGEDEVVENGYINVFPTPTGDFTYSISNQTVAFTPSMTNADSYQWSFGDGQTSTEFSPTYTYSTEADFDVTLTVSNSCGDDVVTRRISTFPNITFVGSQATVEEDNVDGQEDCRGFVDVSLSLQSSKPIAGGDAIVTLELDGDASNNADYRVLTDPIVFPVGTSLLQNVMVRVYDDQALENLETAGFTITLSGTSSSVVGDNDHFDLNIEDNEAASRLNERFANVGLPGRWSRSQLADSDGWEFGRAADLSSQTLFVPGDPNERIAGVNAARCDCDNGADLLITPLFNISDLVHAELVFDVFLPGTDGSTGSVRLVTSTGATFDLADITPQAGAWQRGVVVDLDRFVGQSNVRVIFRHDDNGNRGDGLFLDNVRIIGQRGTPIIANLLDDETEVYFGPFASIYFKEVVTDRIIAKLENRTSFDYGCTRVSIDRIGTGASPFTDNNPTNYVTDRTLLVEPERNTFMGSYEMTMYYRNAEVVGWEAATLNDRVDLVLIQSRGQIKNVTPSNPLANGPNQVTVTSSALYTGNNLKLSGIFSGFLGGYTAGNGFGLTPLPVELLYFSGKAVSPELNLLEWATSTEVNSSHFIVERSADGQRFEDIAQLPAAFNSAVQKTYNFADEAPLKGINYYRLRQVDQDGQFAYSNIIQLASSSDDKEISFFPNPTNDILNVQLRNVEDREVVVSIYNSGGVLMSRQQYDVDRKEDRLELQMGDLAEGIYFIRVEGALGTTAYDRVMLRK